MSEKPTGVSLEQTAAVGAIVRQARLAAGMARLPMAKKAGVSDRTWERIEAGADRYGEVYLMRESTCYKVAAALGINPNQLLEPLSYEPSTDASAADATMAAARIERLQATFMHAMDELQELAAEVRRLQREQNGSH
jgi:transcriptional regulator with XRE-family HTH domain